MNQLQIVNISLFRKEVILLILAILFFSGHCAFSQTEMKADRYMIIPGATLPTELVKNTESIQQVLIRSVLLSKQFELLFAPIESVSSSKLRVYELTTVITASEKHPFFNIRMELKNPKISKIIRAEYEEMIHGNRMLHTLRIMTLRLIFGEAYFKKNREKLEKISAQDPPLDLGEKLQNPSLPPAKKIEDINKQKKDYDNAIEGIDKKPDSPQAEKEAPFFRDKTYALGMYYQNQGITSSGTLLDVNNSFTSILIDLHTHWKIDPQSLAIFSARYGKTTSKYKEAIPDSLQFTGLYDHHLFSKIRGIGGFRLDKTHFAQLPGLNQGIHVGSITALWAQLGIESGLTLFSRRMLLSASLLKSLQASTDFPNVSGGDIAGQGYVAFFAYELAKKYFLAFEYSTYIIDIAGVSTFSNSDKRMAFGLYFPLGDK